MLKFNKFLESLDEAKIVIKRRYTENHPEKNVRRGANIRNSIIEALRDKKLTLSEFNEIVGKHSKNAYKWTQRNKRFFTIKEDNVTLSRYGSKIAKTLQPVNEKNHDKKSVLKALGKNDDAMILYRGQEYIIYNPDNGNDENTEMWGDKTVFALDQDGDEIEVAYKDIERIDASHQINLDEAKAPKSWDSQFTMNAIEAYKNGEFDLEDDKSITDWDKEYNGGKAPKPAFNTKEVVSYAVKTGKKPNGDKIDESVEINERAKATQMLKHVVKGLTTDVEGIKLSKEMAQAYLDWLQTSSYGKRYNGLPFEMIFKASFNWGIDRYTKNLKDEYKQLKTQAKSMKEMVHRSFVDFVNETYDPINEKLKSAKLRNLLDMKKTPKSILKAIYGKTKLALDKITDDQIVDIDPKDGQNQRGFVFYYTTQQKENPYSDGRYGNDLPANCLLAVGSGKEFWYITSNYKGRKTTHSLSTNPKGGFSRWSSNSDIGTNKQYRGWDASGLGSVKRVQDVADAAFVINPEGLENSIDKVEQRVKAKEGAIAFDDPKEFKEANLARYKKILTQRSETLDVDKEVENAIIDIAKLMSDGIKKKETSKYGELIMGTGQDGRPYRINDLTNFTSSLMQDYERWSGHQMDIQRAKDSIEKGDDSGSRRGDGQWEVKYYTKQALEYAKSIKDRLKKLKKRNLAW
jgi:hypothetical protein